MQTYDGIVLLGWMTQEDALQYLKEDCIFDPPLSDKEATLLWEKYRSEVETLGTRSIQAPERIPITDLASIELINYFLKIYKFDPSVLDVIKIDPLQLLIRQFDIVLDVAKRHVDEVGAHWVENALLPKPSPFPESFSIRAAPNSIDIKVPDGEWVLVFDQEKGLMITQRSKYVNVFAFDQRMLLWAGYHRVYAKVQNHLSKDQAIIVALTKPIEAETLFASNLLNPRLKDLLLSDCPPLFKDFFNERLVLKVKLRKKRYELWIRGQIRMINNE